MGPSPFYDAADGSNLSNALSDITGSLLACTAPVLVPADYETVQVMVNGASISEDPAGADGWQLTADNVLHLYGPACATAAQPGATVDVSFVCAP